MLLQGRGNFRSAKLIKKVQEHGATLTQRCRRRQCLQRTVCRELRGNAAARIKGLDRACTGVSASAFATSASGAQPPGLVTGRSQSSGHASARALCELGARVIVTGTRSGFADQDDPIDGATWIQSDFARAEARAALAAQIATLDILVNNAGIGRPNEYDQDAFEVGIDINLNAVMDLSMRLFPALKAS